MKEEIRNLIVSEQSKNKRFITTCIDTYIDKLFQKAEFAVSLDKGKCRGFVAYYCNDEISKTAYITLILVAPEYRNTGVGQLLVTYVLLHARRRSFLRCHLEVNKHNTVALGFYEQLGFSFIEDRPESFLLGLQL